MTNIIYENNNELKQENFENVNLALQQALMLLSQGSMVQVENEEGNKMVMFDITDLI